MQYSSGKIIAASFTAILLLSTQIVFALVVPAIGGEHISNDSVGASWTTLTGPEISEQSSGDIGTGTIVLSTPSGFVFDTNGIAPDVLIKRTGGQGPDSENLNGVHDGSVLSVTSVTSSAVMFTVTKSTDNNVKNSLTWENLRVRPTTFSPLASGNIVRSGTAILRGIPHEFSYGVLSEINESDNLQPEVLNVGSSSADGSYQSGDQVAIVVSFNESVEVSGSPTITLMIGQTPKKANYLSGSGTNKLTFVYIVSPSDKAQNLDYASSHALALDGGTIKDAATNRIDASLVLPAPGSTHSLSENSYIALNTIPLGGSEMHDVASVQGVVLGVSTTRFDQEMMKLVQIILPNLVHVLLLH